MTPQRFETRRQAVEAVQLTADADWEAIAEWCGGEIDSIEWVDRDAAKRIKLGPDSLAYVAYEDEWIVLSEGKRYVLTDEDFSDEFQPVPDLEGLVGEIRQALEGTTPGPWKWVEDGESMWLEGFDDADVLHGDEDRWVHMTQADGELIAAAPNLLARAADRIEALEARLASRSVWLIWHHGNPPDGRVLWACTTEEEAKRACEEQLAWGDEADYEECRLCDETTVYENGYPKEGA